eukprot:Skav210553  [mRNA]  locus=scaffold2699:20794:26351:- [translate_table: standard]
MSTSSSVPSLEAGRRAKRVTVVKMAVVVGTRQSAPGSALGPRLGSARGARGGLAPRDRGDRAAAAQQALRGAPPGESPPSSKATSRRTSEAGPVSLAPRMTVDISKLSKELAKRWTNVTSQERSVGPVVDPWGSSHGAWWLIWRGNRLVRVVKSAG